MSGWYFARRFHEDSTKSLFSIDKALSVCTTKTSYWLLGTAASISAAMPKAAWVMSLYKRFQYEIIYYSNILWPHEWPDQCVFQFFTGYKTPELSPSSTHNFFFVVLCFKAEPTARVIMMTFSAINEWGTVPRCMQGSKNHQPSLNLLDSFLTIWNFSGRIQTHSRGELVITSQLL